MITASPLFRAVIITALLQVVVIVCGTLFVTGMAKAAGYDLGHAMRAEVVFVRNHGWRYLGIPLLWAGVVLALDRNYDDPWIARIALGLGVVGVLYAIVFYAVLGLMPSSLPS